MMVGAAGDSGHGNMRLLAHNFADQEAERYWARSKTGVLAHPTTTCSPARRPLPMVPWLPKTEPPIGDRVLIHRSLWGTLHPHTMTSYLFLLVLLHRPLALQILQLMGIWDPSPLGLL